MTTEKTISSVLNLIIADYAIESAKLNDQVNIRLDEIRYSGESTFHKFCIYILINRKPSNDTFVSKEWLQLARLLLHAMTEYDNAVKLASGNVDNLAVIGGLVAVLNDVNGLTNCQLESVAEAVINRLVKWQTAKSESIRNAAIKSVMGDTNL